MDLEREIQYERAKAMSTSIVEYKSWVERLGS